MDGREAWDEALPIPRPPGTLSALAVALTAVACYANSVDGRFVFDDSEAIVNNEDVRPDRPVWELLRNDFWGGRLASNLSHKSYRPLTVLSFRWNHWLSGGLHPRGFRLTNVLLHGLVSLLAHSVFGAVLGDRCPRAALVAALLFAVHPVHTEAVAGVVGRADLLSALFFFLSLLAYRGALGRPPAPAVHPLGLILSILLAALAMLAKEQGITAIGVCSAYDAVVHCRLRPGPVLRLLREQLTELRPAGRRRNHSDSDGDDPTTAAGANGSCPALSPDSGGPEAADPAVLRRLLTRQCALLAAGLLLLGLRWRAMGSGPPAFQPVDNPASFADSAATRVLTYNYLYALNAWLLLCPDWLCFDWSMGCVPLLTGSGPDPRLAAPALLWLGLLLLARAALTHPCGRTRRSLAMGLALMLVPFLPAANVFFRVGFVLAERVLYLPSAGYCLLAVVGLRQLALALPARCRPLLQACCAGLGATLLLRSAARSAEWRTEASLFRSGLRVCPLNAKVHYNIAKDAGDAGDKAYAHAEYREALRLHPEYDQAMNNLANLLKDDGQLAEAEALLRRAVTIRPSFAAAWMNLGIVLAGLKRYPEAEASYLTAIRHRSKYPDCYYNLGNLYLEQKRHEAALQAWRNATHLKPSHSLAWSNMVVLLDNMGEGAQAEAAARRALAALPSEPALHFTLGNTLGKAGRFLEAEHHFLAALALDQGNAVYHTNLGVLYHRWKQFGRAQELYRQALRLEPGLRSAQDNLAMLQRAVSRAGRQPSPQP